MRRTLGLTLIVLVVAALAGVRASQASAPLPLSLETVVSYNGSGSVSPVGNHNVWIYDGALGLQREVLGCHCETSGRLTLTLNGCPANVTCQVEHGTFVARWTDGAVSSGTLALENAVDPGIAVHPEQPLRGNVLTGPYAQKHLTGAVRFTSFVGEAFTFTGTVAFGD